MKDDRYFSVFGFLIHYSLLIVMSGSLLFDYPPRFVFMMALGSWAVYLVYQRFQHWAAPVLGGVLLLYGVALLSHPAGYLFNVPMTLFLERLRQTLDIERLVDFLGQVVAYYGEPSGDYAAALPTRVFTVVTGVFTLVVGRLTRRRNIRLLLFLPPLFFMVQWIRYVDISFVAIRWYMIGFIGYLMYVRSQVRFSQKKSRYNKFTPRDYFVYSLLIATTVMVLTSLVFAAYPLRKINAEVSSFMPTFTSLRTGYTARSDEYVFSFDESMYMPGGERLGGRITNRNYDEVMLVKSDRGGQYLRGRVKDLYTGESWRETDNTYRNRFVFAETEIPAYTMTVHPTEIQTATIFAPLGVKEIDLNINKLYVNQDEIYYYKRDSLEKRLEAYTMTVYERPVSRAMIQDLDPYLQLPDVMSARVVDLSLLITSEDTLAKDKVESIRRFLKDNYPYTLFVNYVPDGVEFVDYFLFEEQKGYCTYFATAMTVMARINGIPARYVEGYITEREPDYLGYYPVTGDRAHAWVEVYVDGVWQTVEATPHYLDELDDRPIEVDVEEGTDATVTDRPEEEEDLMDPEVPGFSEEDSSRPLFWLYALAIVLTGALALTGFILYRKKRRLGLGGRIERMIRLIEADETLTMRTRIPEKALNHYAMKMLGYRLSEQKMELLQKALYSSLPLTNEEKTIIMEEVAYLEDLMKAHVGKITFYRTRVKQGGKA